MPKIPQVTVGKPTGGTPKVSIGKPSGGTPRVTLGRATGEPASQNVPGITNGSGGVKKITLQQAIEQAGSDVPVLVIEELTGFKRRVTLRARGLPFAGSLKFATELDVEESKYVGFPRINQTVLSVHDKETEMNGYWHERFLDENAIESSAAVNEQLDDGSDAVSVQSLGIRTPIEACKLFDDITRRASVLRLSWNHIARVGRLATFEQDWTNLHDVKWRMLFKWIGTDDKVGSIAPARTSLVGLAAAFSASFAGAKDATAFDSLAQSLDPTFADSVDTLIGQAQKAVSEISDAVEARIASVTDSVDAIRRVTTIATFVQDRAQKLVDTLNGTVAAMMLVPETPGQTFDTLVRATDTLGDADLVHIADDLTKIDPGKGFAAACQQYEAIRAGRALKHTAARQRRNALRNLDSNVIAIVKMKAQQDLRDLALRWYDNADDWNEIRSFNHFTSSVVPAGTVVFIPALNPT